MRQDITLTPVERILGHLHPWRRRCALCLDLVAEKTDGGSVEVVVHYGGALGYKSADHFDAVGEGALEIADTYGGALGGIDPQCS